MSDRKTIYLDDAIDAICKVCSMEEDYHKCNGYPETSTWCDSLVALRALPSASEIIRCKDCKHRPKLDEEEGELVFPPTYRCPCYCDDCYYSWMPKDDWFCGNGERKN